MLQIPKHTHKAGGKSYESFIAAYLPPGNNAGVIGLAIQHEKILWLNADTINGNFYFIVDLLDDAILHCYGVDRWLGYNCDNLTLKKYREVMHPAHALVQSLYAAATWQLFINNHLPPLQFMQPVCAALTALKKIDGSYLYCRRLCSPWQINAAGRLTQYLCRFTVINHFENEPFGAWLYHNDKQLREADKIMQTLVRKQFESGAFFSPQELRVLKTFAANPAATNAEVAGILLTGVAAVNTYNKRIMEKAEKLFMRRFDNAKQAAAYMARMYLV